MKNLDAIAHELRELKLMREELDAQIESLEAELKSEMYARETDTLSGYDWSATYKTVTTKRVNQNLLKEKYPEIAEECTATTVYRRFNLK